MAGFIYRRAVALKEFGERRGMGWLVRLGLALRELAGSFPVEAENRKAVLPATGRAGKVIDFLTGEKI
jgi:hypothetical protein